VYAREVDGRPLTFSVSGLLWRHSLIMLDQETDSLWSHILGECKRGELQGKKLTQIPSVMTSWESWRRDHPHSTVVMLPRTANEYRREFFARRQQFVLGIVTDTETKAWGFDLLTRQPVVEDELEGRPVVVLFDQAQVTARLYERELDGQVLSLRWSEGGCYDDQTGSRWNAATGRALEGPLRGRSLTALPAIVSYREVWRAFHPRSEIRSWKRAQGTRKQ
jgi:hypothetical protein